jgi:hypothetical protein
MYSDGNEGHTCEHCYAMLDRGFWKQFEREQSPYNRKDENTRVSQRVTAWKTDATCTSDEEGTSCA